MTGRIIPLHGDLHDDANALLPWYATGRLDAEDRARVEAHLSGCAQCQADLAMEQRLHSALAGLGEDIGDVDDAFARLAPRLMPRQPLASRVRQQWRQSAPWMRWAMAAQISLLILAGGALVAGLAQQPREAPQYHALGAAPAPAAANVVVVFQPDIRESDLRQTLRLNHARLVDGPTAADGYLLHVAPSDRAAILARLKGDKAILLAEPIDAGDRP